LSKVSLPQPEKNVKRRKRRNKPSRKISLFPGINTTDSVIVNNNVNFLVPKFTIRNKKN